ncbi:helix-turn-helix domain-containing protein [Chryseobacterium oncorhynchi]|uniref:HTH cro/C1-type domain-containing protein n=1 Tax=Chryseobacterium oncorhynchi TaxID=741074 RepID=A0A316WL47_9FLAO|nr:helix-turn-helix transcriptional regulator [Chryseobacterium oncorhynchi]PWN59160.1 hypothetical protein C1638_021935 [Chryseobacterium oncorhynchi]
MIAALLEIFQRKRINKNLTLEDIENLTFSHGMKINSYTIMKIENGDISPNLDQLIILLKALECNLNIDGIEIIP